MRILQQNKEVLMIPKFRAWLIEEKEMCEVLDLDFEEKFSKVNRKKLLGSGSHFSFEEIHLMQWTGLVDSEGMEIFKDDIVKDITFEDQDVVEVIEVRFENDCHRLGWNLPTDRIYKIIGNIHANPELLEDK